MIDDIVKLKLIKLAEPAIITSLIARKLVIHLGGTLSWDNVKIPDDILQSIEEPNNSIEPENIDNLIDNLISIFPKAQTDSRNAIISRYEQWKKKSPLKDITYDEIIDAAQQWVSSKGDVYCGRLIYFFFKEEHKIYNSRLENIVITTREKENNASKASITNIKVDWGNIDLK